MKFRLIGLGVFIAILFTETHSVFTHFWPKDAEIDVRHWFMKPVPFLVPLKWWIKMSTDDILLCVLFFSAARISLMVSYRLFLIFGMWFLYFVFDYLMFLYHYKLDYWIYYCMLSICACTLVFLIIPMKEDKGGGIIRRLF